MLFINNEVRLLDLFDLEDQKSKTIALAVTPIIQHLYRSNLVVTAICTDNASNERALLNPANDYSLQQLTGLPILRLPCLAHTGNLGTHDFLNSGDPSILSQLQLVVKSLPRGSGSPFHSLPRINETRWLSCGETVMFILQHYSAIEGYLSEKNFDVAVSALRMLTITDLAQVLNLLSLLIVRIEGNSTTYNQVFPAFASAIWELEHLPGNRYSQSVVRFLTGRLTSTTDFSWIVATYLLSPSGHHHIRQFQRYDRYPQLLEARALEGIKTLCNIFKLENRQIEHLFRFYIWEMETEETSTIQHWAHFPSYLPLREARTIEENRLRQANVFSEESGCTSTAPLVELGHRMAVFPATECSCERLFCNVRNLIGDFRQSVSSTTLRNLVRIRLHHLWNDDRASDVQSVTSRLQAGVDDESVINTAQIQIQ
jgi:hypothetical protein